MDVVPADVPADDQDVVRLSDLPDQVTDTDPTAPASADFRYFVTQTRCRWMEKTECGPWRWDSMATGYNC